MKIAVLEDEAPARRALVRDILAAAPGATVVAELASLAETERWFATTPQVDLLFSDIRLSDGTVFTLLNERPAPCPVVFVTAYDNHALQAFAAAGIGYLLKPVGPAALQQCLQDYHRLARQFGKTTLDAMSSMLSPEHPRQRILCRDGQDLHTVPVEKVAWLRARDRLTWLMTRDGSQGLVDASLTALEEELDRTRFFRAHRQALVHVEAIRSFRSAGKGRILVTVEPPWDGELMVSQENAAAFRTFVDR